METIEICHLCDGDQVLLMDAGLDSEHVTPCECVSEDEPYEID